MRRVFSYSPKSIFSTGGIVAETDAGIAPMILIRFPSQRKPGSCRKRIRLKENWIRYISPVAQSISLKQPARNKLPQDNLSTIKPSGKREENFFELVYEIVRQIPGGRVTSYGAIAVCLGTRLSARMVGWAMNSAHQLQYKVPAHRVVNRKGMLTGKNHFGTPYRMQELLESEGVIIKDDQIVDFEKHFWDPSKELM